MDITPENIIPLLFGAYMMGWASGFLIKFFTQLMEKV